MASCRFLQSGSRGDSGKRFLSRRVITAIAPLLPRHCPAIAPLLPNQIRARRHLELEVGPIHRNIGLKRLETHARVLPEAVQNIE